MTDAAGRQLVTWGRAVLVRTRGRRSERDREVVLGFVEEPDGSLLVAAGSPDADWALNLLAQPGATVTVGERTWPVVAESLDGAAAAAAVRSLILRYGTPSEGLGSGPSFRLRVDPATADGSA
jgi:deazaflavin-dependent oxidoreductase (nitroreductase family)